MKNIDRRIEAVERGLDALQRAYMLLQRGVPPALWPDAELNAYCDTLPPEIRNLTDEQLAELVAAAPGQVARILETMLEC